MKNFNDIAALTSVLQGVSFTAGPFVWPDEDFPWQIWRDIFEAMRTGC